jgi:nucleotide-binding universal stress UspA family protein
MKVKVDVKVTVGDAREVICGTVERINADILVMGSHGYGFIKRYMIPLFICPFNSIKGHVLVSNWGNS